MLICRNIVFEDDLNWDLLVNNSTTASFFQSKEWLSVWLKHFPQETIIFGIFDSEQLVGIAPFSVSNMTASFLGTTEVLGGELVSDFGDIIAKISCEEIVWKEILAKLKTQNSKFKIELNYIREESPSFEIMKHLGGKAEETDVAPYIELPKSWEEYLASLERHERHELKRKIRKLEEAEAFKIYYEGNPSDIEEFFRLMRLSNEQKRDFLSEKMENFFRDIISTFHPKNMLSLCFLKLNGKNIAAILSFIYRDEVLLYNSGFDPKYSYLAPGLVLKAYAIKQAIEEGKNRFDFLRGGEHYKYDLGGKKRNLYKISFLNSESKAPNPK